MFYIVYLPKNLDPTDTENAIVLESFKGKNDRQAMELARKIWGDMGAVVFSYTDNKGKLINKTFVGFLDNHGDQ
jgi:hypothetical protein